MRQLRCLLKVNLLRIRKSQMTKRKPQMGERKLSLTLRLWRRRRLLRIQKFNLKIPQLLTTQLRAKSSLQMSLMLKTIKRLIRQKLILESRLQKTINRILIRQSLLMKLKLKSSPPRSQMRLMKKIQAMRLSQLILRLVRIAPKKKKSL